MALDTFKFDRKDPAMLLQFLRPFTHPQLRRPENEESSAQRRVIAKFLPIDERLDNGYFSTYLVENQYEQMILREKAWTPLSRAVKNFPGPPASEEFLHGDKNICRTSKLQQ
jgi:hypothetical protein